MITPKLEELILCGQAEYRTLGCRFSSNYKMKIPDNCIVVVTDIIWNNFLQTFEDNNPSVSAFFNANAFQLRFYDTSRKYNHISIRNGMDFVTANSFMGTDAMSDALDKGVLIPKPPVQFHCYFVHKNFLEINLIKHELNSEFTYTFGQINDPGGMLDRPPIDTGGIGGLNTVKYARNNITDTVEYYPQSLEFTTAPPPASDKYGSDFIQLNNQRYQIIDPLVLDPRITDAASPLFTVGYVLIRDQEIYTQLGEK